MSSSAFGIETTLAELRQDSGCESCAAGTTLCRGRCSSQLNAPLCQLVPGRGIQKSEVLFRSCSEGYPTFSRLGLVIATWKAAKRRGLGDLETAVTAVMFAVMQGPPQSTGQYLTLDTTLSRCPAPLQWAKQEPSQVCMA